MTSRRSPPESKAAAKPVRDGKDVESDAPDPKAMGRFRALAKKVVNASPEQIREQERRNKKH